MPTAPTHGEIGEGVKVTVPIYEGTFTRADAETPAGTIIKSGTYAAQIPNDSIKNKYAYVIAYTSFDDYAYQLVGDAALGNTILGRVISINRDIPQLAADGDTQVAALTNVRYGVVELFRVGQIIMVRVNGSGTTIDLGDKLSLDTGSKVIWKQDNSNGILKALETTSGADVWIPAEVI